MISYVIPTRDRPDDLARTLRGIGSLLEHDPAHPAHEPAEVIVIDNASRFVPILPAWLDNRVPVRLVLLNENLGAASRNIGAKRTSPDSQWIVMLDDDSMPVDGRFIQRLHTQPPDVAAVMADIHLPNQDRREDGGLPEVFVGCGVAIRRETFTSLGGYDHTFEYYAEEYDLSARILRSGSRIVFEPDFRIDHFKSAGGRDMNRIVARLVRNGCWVMQRYAPQTDRRTQLRQVRTRARLIAMLENATEGYKQGLAELRESLPRQVRSPLDRTTFDRFTGLWHARQALQRAHADRPFSCARVVGQGKNAWVVQRALAELGVSIDDESDVLVVGTMSPGPMLDTRDRFADLGRVITPWSRTARVARRA